MSWRTILKTANAAASSRRMVAGAADARAIKWARSGDALTLDPHAQNEGPTHNLLHLIYEPLILRDRTGKLLPTLATSWQIREDDPTMWEFKLRQGVKFHNGNTFNADDVVFSLERALQPTSDMKGLLTFIDKVSKVDDHTVHIKTKGPNPLVPNYLTNLYMMDKEWAEANNTITVQDYKDKKDNFAVRNANGTGAYTLVSREQDVKTVLKRNDGYWGKGEFPVGITEITYLTIKSDATRVAALLSGEVDFVQDVPVQDIDRLEKTPSLKVNLGPENRTIFLGHGRRLARAQDLQRQGQEPVRRQARAPGHQHGDRPRGHQARGHARPVGAGRRDRPAVRQRLHQGARRPAQGRCRQGQGAAQGRRLSGRLPGHAQLPQRPLHQRRGHLPGGHRHAGQDRHQGEPGGAAEGAALHADPEAAAGDRVLSAGLGRADLRLPLHLLVPLPHPLRQGRHLERDALLQSRRRQEDPEPDRRGRTRPSATPRSPTSGRR